MSYKKYLKKKLKKYSILIIAVIVAFISGILLIIADENDAEDALSSNVINETVAPTALPTETPIVTAAEVSEPDWYLVLLNKSHFMEAGYVPELSEVENGFYFDSRACYALQQMLSDGRAAGLDLRICSAYRDLDKQEQLYNEQVYSLTSSGLSYEEALEEAKTVVAYPGTSEHNIGLAVDIVAGHYQKLDENQAQTAEAAWLKENCWKYGFILRYPVDKTDITGIIFEPWHYRYVGVSAAKEIMERGICLEEYIEEIYTNKEVVNVPAAGQ